MVRRNVSPRYNFWNNFDVRWEFAQLRRLLRRERDWLIEVYRGVEQDPGRRPKTDADLGWVLPDRHAATAFAERVADHLARVGDTESLPSP
jgi:hypothetical protein